MAEYATIGDYEARYGAVADQTRLSTLLGDAGDYLERQLRDARVTVDASDALQASSLTRITCRIVHDVLAQKGAMPGVSQASWSASPYSGSYTFANPSGKFFLYRDEKRELGIGRSRVSSIAPMGAVGNV